MTGIEKHVLEQIPSSFFMAKQGVFERCKYSKNPVCIALASLVDQGLIEQEWFKPAKSLGPAQTAYRRVKC